MSGSAFMGELVDFYSGVGFPTEFQGIADGELPFAKVSDISNALQDGERTISTASNYIDNDVARRLRAKPFPKGTIVFAKIGEAIRKNRRAVSSREMLFDNNVMGIHPKAKTVDTNYLVRFLDTVDFYKLANSTAVPSLRKSVLSELQIPLPPLDEQKRIAAILDKADALRAKRRQAIALLDSLTQSIFLEMFGDPVSNPKGWEVKSLAEFELFLTSGSRGWAEYYSEQGTPFIRIQNLKGGRLSTEDLVFVNAPENAEARRTRVESGDVLISITADLGRVAVVPAHVHQAANINQHIALFRPKGINPAFLSSYLASQGGKRQFAALNRQGVKAGLNFSDIRALKILNPPMEMQRKFEMLAKLVADREIGLSGSSVGIEVLFTSLQHRAFTGQL